MQDSTYEELLETAKKNNLQMEELIRMAEVYAKTFTGYKKKPIWKKLLKRGRNGRA